MRSHSDEKVAKSPRFILTFLTEIKSAGRLLHAIMNSSSRVEIGASVSRPAGEARRNPRVRGLATSRKERHAPSSRTRRSSERARRGAKGFGDAAAKYLRTNEQCLRSKCLQFVALFGRSEHVRAQTLKPKPVGTLALVVNSNSGYRYWRHEVIPLYQKLLAEMKKKTVYIQS